MFTVTEAASAHLAQLLAEAETSENENVVIRISQGKDGLGLMFSQAGPEDTTFAHEGVTVLAIDEKLSQALANNTLDVETTENGTSLQLRSTRRSNGRDGRKRS